MSDNTNFDLKSIFLSLLQDSDIAETLRDIFKKNDENPVYGQKDKEDIKNLRLEIRTAQNIINELSENLKIKEQDNQNLNTANEKLKEQVKLFAEFRSLVETYDNYCALPENLRSGYEKLICAESSLTFLVSASQTENLELIWQRVCWDLNKYDENSISTLKYTLDLLFRYNEKTFHRLERLHTEIGDVFNDKLHDKTADSPQRGVIAEVVLEGYRVQNSKKIVRSIVRLK